jgi:hypothetical protein
MSRKNGGIIGPANTPVGGLFKGVAGGVWRMNDVANFVSNSQWPSTPQSIDNSCRFNDGSTDYLNRTPSGAGNRRTFTISAWVKRGQVTTNSFLFSAWTADNDAGHFSFGFESAERLTVDTYSTNLLTTTRVFRDPTAWYHVVCAVDTTNATADNRVRLYVNGVEQSNYSTRNNPSQNTDLQANNSVIQAVGANYYNSQANVTHDGYMAEFCMIDGLQLDPTSFGETDSTTGIWKPKKIGAFASAGTNSFYLDFKDSSNLGNDASGLNNDFTVNNLTSIDQSTDTCVENYATLNPIYATGDFTFTEGNLQVDDKTTSNDKSTISTIGVTQGKWYLEFKIIDQGTRGYLGFTDGADQGLAEASIRSSPANWGMYMPVVSASSDTSGTVNSNLGTATDNDIICFAFDADNGQLFMSKNGNIDTSTTAAITGITTGNIFHFFVNETASGADVSGYNINFGSPSYSISSSNSDANGFGNFEYAVPSGYYALNTSNLNTYG